VTDIKPGLYDGLDEAEYHGHKGSVSVSGAKKLLPPSCPAIFKHERDQGQQQRDVFDFGKAAHKEALGVGPELVVVDADNWMTKAAKEAKAAAYADGSVPLLAKDKAAVDAMGAALRAHPIASALLDPDHGKPEQSAFFSDLAHGVPPRPVRLAARHRRWPADRAGLQEHGISRAGRDSQGRR
jgi:hypothetical protein